MENGSADKQRAKQRFLARTEVRTDGCWLWDKPTKLGYGQFWVDGTNRVAHRWCYENFVGPVPEGLVVTHTCGHNDCVNPEHLAAVPPGETRIKNTCGKGHAMDHANTYISPAGIRYCRKCRNAISRERRASGRGRPEGWTALRRRVLERDGETCTVGLLLGLEDECSETLDVHHRFPRRYGGADDPENLFVVCRSHHMRLEGMVRRLIEGKGWDPPRVRRCTHNHRYDHARRECERRLNRAA